MQVWLDLETTGLDLELDQILEIGMIVVDDEYKERHSWSEIIPITHYGNDALQSNEFVLQMHQTNNLIHDIQSQFGPEPVDEDRYGSYCSLIETAAMRWLIEQGVEPMSASMCGATVHFDRAWLKQDMPILEQFFHYRNFDVTTLKAAAKMWFPDWVEIYAATLNKDDVHRAIPDCHDEIDEAMNLRGIFNLAQFNWSVDPTS